MLPWKESKDKYAGSKTLPASINGKEKLWHPSTANKAAPHRSPESQRHRTPTHKPIHKDIRSHPQTHTPLHSPPTPRQGDVQLSRPARLHTHLQADASLVLIAHDDDVAVVVLVGGAHHHQACGRLDALRVGVPGGAGWGRRRRRSSVGANPDAHLPAHSFWVPTRSFVTTAAWLPVAHMAGVGMAWAHASTGPGQRLRQGCTMHSLLLPPGTPSSSHQPLPALPSRHTPLLLPKCPGKG